MHNATDDGTAEAAHARLQQATARKYARPAVSPEVRRLFRRLERKYLAAAARVEAGRPKPGDVDLIAWVLKIATDPADES